MENNQTDFMKNRPVADKANQYKDVYGSQKKSTRITVTALLIVVVTILSVVALIYHSYPLLVLFAPALIVLIISLFVARRADRQNTPVKPQSNPEALFKDYEE